MATGAWQGKRCVVVGGSAGLGLQLALELGRQQAEVVICARHQTTLDTAVARIRAETNTDCWGVAADLLTESGAERLAAALREGKADRVASVSTSAEHRGAPPIDLLINAIGKSDRGRLLDLTPEELETQFRINTLPAFLAIRQLRPQLAAARGCVVNIGSLSSKLAPRMLGGYAVGKFALAALSQQLRLELRDEGVHVMLACPGPIRRDDSTTRYADLAAQRQLPPEANRPGGGAKLRGLDPQWLARRILLAAERRTPELIVPSKVRCLLIVQACWPALGDWLLRRSTA